MDMRFLMRQAQQMQAKLQEAQQNLRAEGTAGGELVKVVLNGSKELMDLSIAKDAIDPEDPSMLEDLLKAGGSDLHLTTGNPPMARIQSRLVPLKGPVFAPGEIGAFLYSIMTEEQAEAFEKKKELDFAYALTLEKRFRVNVHRQRGQTEAAIRVVPSQVGNWKELTLPPIVEQWARKPDGLILIAGPTGSGKTTTLNTLVRMINDQREGVVICLERPIEYVHTNKKSIIKQREIGNDTISYAEAVRQAMRQDPDVIVVGEIEDQETVLTVLNAAQAGNLVFASVHGSNTEGAIDRLINLCSADQRQQVTFQLSTCLHGIMTQHLFPREHGQMSGTGAGLVLATEVFVMTEAAQNHIRTNNLVQLRSVIETGVGLKMHTLESSIKQLSDKGMISPAISSRYLYSGKRPGG